MECGTSLAPFLTNNRVILPFFCGLTAPSKSLCRVKRAGLNFYGVALDLFLKLFLYRRNLDAYARYSDALRLRTL